MGLFEGWDHLQVEMYGSGDCCGVAPLEQP